MVDIQNKERTLKSLFLLASLTVMTALLGACAVQSGSMKPHDIEAAKAECFEQAQDMTNSTVDPMNPVHNDYFKTCMRTRFNYTDEQLATLGYK